MPFLLDLPPELTIRVLFHLSLRDITACQLTHSSLRTLIDNSISVKYQIATQVAGVEDNPVVKLSVYDRLKRLKVLEAGWARLDFEFSKTVEVKYDNDGWSPEYYDGLTGGVFVVGNTRAQAFDYCTLPNKVEDETSWKRVNIGESITTMGLGRYEHDLVAVITAMPQDVTSGIHNLEIVLLEFSTGKPHPKAQQPRIFVAASRWGCPEISIEIVGDLVALVTTSYDNPYDPDDDFYIFDWKTGALKVHASAPNNSYASLLFLSPTLLLLPNSVTNTLEFWDTDAASISPFPIGALGLPALNDGYHISEIACQCEPNPVVEGIPHSRQPFHTAPADAIVIFNMDINLDEVSTSFSMFVHRGTLMGLCPPARDGEGEFEVVPWAMWGPPVTRWLSMNIRSEEWISTTAGARAAVLFENVGAIGILDFHPARIPRTREREQNRNKNKQKELRMWVEDGEQEIVNPAFAERLVSRLPYVARMLEKRETYDRVVMDEERLIGLKLDQTELRVREIVIHHLGATPARATAGGAGTEVLSINETDGL